MKILYVLFAIFVGIFSVLGWMVLLINPLWFREAALAWYNQSAYTYFNPFK